MTAIIVDDEPMAINLLKGYLEHFSSIELIGTFRNALKAFEFINKEKVDVVFLDINMPHLSGLSFSKMIDPNTKIIFTTAYSEHAAESYEVNAIDYLLKPISLARFTKAMSKVLNQVTISQEKLTNNQTLMIKSGTKIHQVESDQIFLLEKDGNYIHYHLTDQKIMARQSVAEALVNLPDHFLQIHKSYIVNVMKVDYIDRLEVSVNKTIIPLSPLYKEELLRRLERSN
jgi:DNA-binding LytR/AlgR family response regulator